MQRQTSYSIPLTQPVICVVGPTASGKTELAQTIAVACNAEITSADSMQIYRGMDIGTGQITASNMRVPHHGLNLVDPGEPFSAALFQEYARKTFRDVDGRGLQNVLCGGTGFYVRAAIDEYDFPEGEQRENPVRQHWQQVAETEGAEAVWCALYERDPESANAVHPHNVKRVIRALEMHEQGIRYCDQLKALHEMQQAVPASFVAIEWERGELYQRINNRVDTMVEAGLVSEVEGLLTSGFRQGLTSREAIGYKEIVAYLDRKCTLDEAVESIKQSTRRYAKRQISWFKNDQRVHWISAQGKSCDDMCAETLQLLDTIKRDLEG